MYLYVLKSGSKPSLMNVLKQINMERKRNNQKKPNKKEELSEIVLRRNKRLNDFFKLLGLNVKVVQSLKNANNPPMVLNDEFILNAYVHNFELRFTDNPIQGNVIYSVKLTEKPLFDKNKVLSAINDYEKRPVYKVYLKTEPVLYLAGYNFLNKEVGLGRYPVFSSYQPKIYFNREKAEEICEELKNIGYSAFVC
jgi:hypothetical protein